MGVGNPKTVKGEIFKLAATHFLFGYVDKKKEIITQWLCITEVARLLWLIHEELIPFERSTDKKDNISIYISIQDLIDNNLVDYHFLEGKLIKYKM